MPRLGYLGTGLMGEPMVMNLLKAGYEVTVWNRTASKCDAAVAAGARRAESPADLARQSDVVMACLTNAAAVEAVLFGDHGVAEVTGPDTLDTVRLSARLLDNLTKALRQTVVWCRCLHHQRTHLCTVRHLA